MTVTVYPLYSQFHVCNLDVDPWLPQGPSNEDLERRYVALPGSIYLFTKESSPLELEIILNPKSEAPFDIDVEAIDAPLTVDHHGAITFETVGSGKYPHIPVPPGDYTVHFSHIPVSEDLQKGRLVFKAQTSRLMR